MAKELSLTPNQARKAGLEVNQDGVRRSAYELLAQRGIDIARLAAIWPELRAMQPDVAEQIETEARYAVYLDRQAGDAAILQRESRKVIPEDFDYSALPGLSLELRQKLSRRQPRSLLEASRVDGMTPAALALVLTRLSAADRKRVA